MKATCVSLSIVLVTIVAVILITATTTSHAIISHTHADTGSSLMETKSKYTLPVHRSLSELAFDRVKLALGSVSEARNEHAEARGAYKRFKGEAPSQSNSGSDSNKKKSILGNLKSILKSKFDVLHAKTVVAVGKGLDFLFGKRSEAKSTLDKSETLEELVHRVNLRLGVTYPDVPLPGNNPISTDNSLRDIALKLFTARHTSSLSWSGASAMASSHEGDRQYWHAMTADKNPVTNDKVLASIKVNMRELYVQSRRATDEQRWWWYGRMLHCIQDSYSDAHVARDFGQNDLPITFFQNYAQQKMKLHALSDSSPVDDAKELAGVRFHGKKGTEKTKKLALLAQRKRRLYAMAQTKTTEFLRIVWNNRRKPGRAEARDLWPQIDRYLNSVFVFSTQFGLDWAAAPTGGSLPDYAANPSNARLRNWFSIAYAFWSKLTTSMSHYFGVDMFTLSLKRIVARDLASGDTFGSNEVFIVVKTVIDTFQTDVAVPHKLRTHKEDEDVFNLDHTLYGSGMVQFSVYDSDRVVGVPTQAESDLIGEGEVHIGLFVPLLDDSPRDIEVKLFHNGKRQGSLVVTGKANRVEFATVEKDKVLAPHGNIGRMSPENWTDFIRRSDPLSEEHKKTTQKEIK
jgi:hypothetical protein